MKKVRLRESKANANELLRLADEEGEIVEVTRHGQVIARLVPATARKPEPPMDRDHHT